MKCPKVKVWKEKIKQQRKETRMERASRKLRESMAQQQLTKFDKVFKENSAVAFEMMHNTPTNKYFIETRQIKLSFFKDEEL